MGGYSLLLLGVVLGGLGIRLLRSAPRLADTDPSPRGQALRASLAVVALVVPLIPINTFFAIPLTVIGAINLVVLMSSERRPSAVISAGPAVRSLRGDPGRVSTRRFVPG